mgnify:CR=1 FL=1
MNQKDNELYKAGQFTEWQKSVEEEIINLNKKLDNMAKDCFLSTAPATVRRGVNKSSFFINVYNFKIKQT